MNEMQDKQYLALELTKIRLDHLGENESVDCKIILNTYEFFLTELLEVTNIMETIEEQHIEIETLRKKLQEKIEHPEHGTKLHRLIDVVNQCKGDMEQYVYECLMAEITMKIQ